MDYPFMDNAAIEISAIIAANLGAWMQATPALDTIKKVSTTAKVGFGTVRRARNGDGNTTIQNLELIAGAFKRRPEDLLAAPNGQLQQPAPEYEVMPPLIAELLDVAHDMSERGQIELIGRAKELARLHPRAKAKRAG